jgi:hypothetical protein
MIFICESYTGNILCVSREGDVSVFANTKSDGPSRAGNVPFGSSIVCFKSYIKTITGGPIGITCDQDDNLFVAYAHTSKNFSNPVGKLLRLSHVPRPSPGSGSDTEEGNTALARDCEELWSAPGMVPKGIAVTRTGLAVLSDSGLKKQLVFIDTSTGEQLLEHSIVNDNLPQNQADAGGAGSNGSGKLRRPNKTRPTELADVAIQHTSARGGPVAYVTSGPSVLSVKVGYLLEDQLCAIAEQKAVIKRSLRTAGGSDSDSGSGSGSSPELQQQLTKLRARERIIRMHLQ